MSGSTRPSMKSVQRSLITGILVGLTLGCAIGAGLVGLYIRQNPPVYAGGAYPKELTQNYQGHYLAMVIDSYLIDEQVGVAGDRLKTFDEATKIRAFGIRSANYVASGHADKAQAINELAVALKGVENWNSDTISTVASQLATEFQGDDARAQAITTFASQLGQVPLGTGQPAVTAQPPEATVSVESTAADEGGFSLRTVALVCLGLILVALVAFVLYSRLFGTRAGPPKPEVVWEGEGPAPLKHWTGAYTLGLDTYDEFFTIETESGDFLGESGMGILEAIPDTKPKQVTAFEIGLFDKTDITTIARIIMSEHAFYNDEALRAKVDANQQAEAVLATPGGTFALETSAMRVEVKIEEMEYGEGGRVYFNKLNVALDVFLNEGADLKIGTMDIPEQYKV